MITTAIILAAGSNSQNECFWPSYHSSIAGIDYDLIVVHRDMQFIPNNIVNKYGNVIYENKINHGEELPHKAFGVYREYWNKYQNDYDMFAFISDDVIIKTDNWLVEAINLLDKYEKLGFVGTQIFNGSLNQYPHMSHCRSPAWFGKSSALKQIKWQFKNDHWGEMKLAYQFLRAGFFGAQVGNKMDIAYDALESGGAFIGDHIVSILERNFGLDIRNKIPYEKRTEINNRFINMLINGDDSMIIESPFRHIGPRRVISQLQPFHGLLFDKSIELAKQYANQYNFGIFILE